VSRETFEAAERDLTPEGGSGALRCDKGLLPRFGLVLRVTLPGRLALEATRFVWLVDVHFLAQHQRRLGHLLALEYVSRRGYSLRMQLNVGDRSGRTGNLHPQGE